MKYVIDIREHAMNDPFTPALYRAKNFNALVFDENGLKKLTPLEEEVKEAEQKAYERGYRVGRIICDAEVRDKAYRDGLKHGYDKCLDDMRKNNGDGLGCNECMYLDISPNEWPCSCCERKMKDMFEAKE